MYINFEDPSIESLLGGPEGIEKIYRSYRMLVCRGKPTVIVLDEVQNVPRWEKWVRMMHEKKDAKIIVTGSSSKLLSSEIATVLTGRTLTIVVFPLTFADFLMFRGVELKAGYDMIAKKDLIMGLLMEYMESGGFPRIAREPDPFTRRALVKEYFDGIIFRDLVQRYGIKDIALIRNLAELCISNASSLTSANKMRGILINILRRKISGNRIVELMGYLESSFLVFFVPIFPCKVKDQKLYPKKTYAVDTGLSGAVSFRFSDDAGKLAENIVFLHLKRAAYDKGEEIFYWKDKEQREVDFVVKRGLKVEALIQVCWNVEDAKVRRRERSIMIKAMDEFKLKKGTIVTKDFEGKETVDGKSIAYIPLCKFLLAGS